MMRRALMLGLLAVQGWAGACFYPNTEDVYLSRFINQQEMKEVPCRPETSSDTSSTKRKVNCYQSSKLAGSVRSHILVTLYSYGGNIRDNISKDEKTFYVRPYGLTISVFPDNVGSFVRVENIYSTYEYVLDTFENAERKFQTCPETDKSIVVLAYCHNVGKDELGFPISIFSLAFSSDSSLDIGREYAYLYESFCTRRLMPPSWVNK